MVAAEKEEVKEKKARSRTTMSVKHGSQYDAGSNVQPIRLSKNLTSEKMLFSCDANGTTIIL